MKPLPTGTQVFETIRKRNALYVDKTDMLYGLVAYNDDCAAKADDALKQINDKQYDAPYNNAKKLGVAIDDKTRQVGEWVEG